MSGEGIHNPYDDTDLLVLIAIIDAICDEILENTVAIEEDTNAIREVTDSEAILTEVADTITTDGNEQTMYTEENPADIFRPICFKIDMTNQTATETVDIKVYYRIGVGLNMILQSDTTFAGAQDPDLKLIELEPNRYGIRITIEKTAGTNRAYDWEVFYEEAP